MPRPKTSKAIWFVVFPGFELLDLGGPLCAFTLARDFHQAGYDIRVISSIGGLVRGSSGIAIDTTAASPRGHVDTLMVVGAPTPDASDAQADTVDLVRAISPRARRTASVCTGAFLLAAAGLLDGRRVTTHWSVASRLATAFPKVEVDADAIYVADGKVRTAAGVTAGLDLALSLVTEDLGRDVGLRVASQLVMYFKRPGGQMQFSRNGEAMPVGRSALQELQRWVSGNLAEDHSVACLAERMQLSPRHFARLFRAEVGITPAAWVESIRVAAAREKLDIGRWAPKQVAADCGFTNADHLRRAFVQHLGVTPAEYRKRHALLQDETWRT